MRLQLAGNPESTVQDPETMHLNLSPTQAYAIIVWPAVVCL